MNHFRTWAEVSLSAITNNLKAVRQATGVGVIAVVKADAYGHGLLPVAGAAAPYADYLAVACLSEAADLREGGLTSPLMTLSPLLPFEAERAVELGVTPLVEGVELAQALSAAAKKMGVITPLHLKVDTGMSRFGVAPREALEVARAIDALPHLQLEGLCSHLACAEDNAEFTGCQTELFETTAAAIEAVLGPVRFKHLANSAGAAFYPNVRHQLIRVGSLVYGLLPCDIPTQPALVWKTRISSLRRLPAGAPVSYGGTFRTQRPSVIATTPVGYADGYLRPLSNRGVALVNGHEVSVAGRVCMDQTMFDVTGVEASVGDEVTLIGGSVTVERLATLAETALHQPTTAIGSRVTRVYLP